jgi:hypothetical protein
MRGIQIGEMSKLDWLIGLVEHAMWADSLYFLYLVLLSVSKILARFVIYLTGKIVLRIGIEALTLVVMKRGGMFLRNVG